MRETWIAPDGMKLILIGPQEKIDRQKLLLTKRWEFARAYGKKMGWPEHPRDWTLKQSLSLHEIPEWKDPLNEGRWIETELTIDLGGGGHRNIFGGEVVKP